MCEADRLLMSVCNGSFGRETIPITHQWSCKWITSTALVLWSGRTWLTVYGALLERLDTNCEMVGYPLVNCCIVHGAPRGGGSSASLGRAGDDTSGADRFGVPASGSGSVVGVATRSCWPGVGELRSESAIWSVQSDTTTSSALIVGRCQLS